MIINLEKFMFSNINLDNYKSSIILDTNITNITNKIPETREKDKKNKEKDDDKS